MSRRTECGPDFNLTVAPKPAITSVQPSVIRLPASFEGEEEVRLDAFGRNFVHGAEVTIAGPSPSDSTAIDGTKYKDW